MNLAHKQLEAAHEYAREGNGGKRSVWHEEYVAEHLQELVAQAIEEDLDGSAENGVELVDLEFVDEIARIRSERIYT